MREVTLSLNQTVAKLLINLKIFVEGESESNT